MALEQRPIRLGEVIHPHDHTVDRNNVLVLDKGFVKLIDHMGDDLAIVNAARCSYGKELKSFEENCNLLRYLMRHAHTTPFEMCQLKFHIKAPIFVVRQWHRHRMWSYNEYSGRYSEMKNEYYIPEENKVTFQNPANKQGGVDEAITPFNIKNPDDWWDCLTPEQVNESWSWEDHFSNEQQMNRAYYERRLKSGMRKELARINLPLSQYTEMYASVDLHNLFHFLKLRLDSHAQYEIREYAAALAYFVKVLFPLAYEAFDDYILHSTKFSKTELSILKKLGMDLNYAKDLAEREFTNKREREEFLNKISNLDQ